MKFIKTIRRNRLSDSTRDDLLFIFFNGPDLKVWQVDRALWEWSQSSSLVKLEVCAHAPNQPLGLRVPPLSFSSRRRSINGARYDDDEEEEEEVVVVVVVVVVVEQEEEDENDLAIYLDPPEYSSSYSSSSPSPHPSYSWPSSSFLRLANLHCLRCQTSMMTTMMLSPTFRSHLSPPPPPHHHHHHYHAPPPPHHHHHLQLLQNLNHLRLPHLPPRLPLRFVYLCLVQVLVVPQKHEFRS